MGRGTSPPCRSKGARSAARTGTVGADPVGSEEQRQADMDALFEAAIEGKMTMDEAVERYRAKWEGGKPIDMENVQRPAKGYYGPGSLGEIINGPPRR